MSAMCFPLVSKSIALETGNTLSYIYSSLTYYQYNNLKLSWIILMVIRCRCTSSRWSHDEACWDEAVIWRSRKGRNSSRRPLTVFWCSSRASVRQHLLSGSDRVQVFILSRCRYGAHAPKESAKWRVHTGSSETCYEVLRNINIYYTL